MLILLPPSEGKTAPRRGKPLDLATLSQPGLTEPRAEMLDALVTLCREHPDAAVRTLGLGVTQADAVSRDAALREAPTARADTVYSGVLYEALDLPSMPAAVRRRATSWVAITSGLLGLTRPADRIPAYRLSGNVTLPGVGPVATYWSRHLGPAVSQAAGSGLVVDLRSSTYAAFWRPDPVLSARVMTLRVLHEADGARTVASHFNKATKGRIVRALLEDGTAPRTPARFAEHLAALGRTVERGWTVVVRPSDRSGTCLDVVVTTL